MTPAKHLATNPLVSGSDIVFRLPDAFVEEYATRTPPFGFNGLGELAYYRTYSRVKDDGTNEKWHETVRRVVEGTYAMQRRWCHSMHIDWNVAQARASAQEMYDRMWNMKFLPPGRGLWAMGSPLTEERGLFACLNNCFTGDTVVLTRDGAARLSDLATVEERVEVLAGDRALRYATVRSFGIQPTQWVTFRPVGIRSNHRLQVRATPNHRWLLADGRETTALQVGDIVPSRVHGGSNPDVADEESGFVHGLVFGDGTRHTYYPNRFFIRLCGAKACHLEALLRSPHWRSTTTVEGDPAVTLVTDTNLKALPTPGSSRSYIAGFVAGWLAADGWSKSAGSKALDTIQPDAVDWLIIHAPLAGYVVVGHVLADNDTNYGPRSAPLHRLTLASEWNFIVADITPDEPAEVFCATEDVTHSFVLAGGLLTGNCAFVSTASLAKERSEPFLFLMDASMLGIGVGFDTLGAGTFPIQMPVGDTHYVIPDTREGWVESTKLVLDAYLEGGPLPSFDYSLIRPYGSPIKGFGGIAAGPEPLQKLHHAIHDLLSPAIGTPITITHIVDIMNRIGQCVVAGNVRRTAEVALGSPDSSEYLDLKNPGINPARNHPKTGWGWTSNNSVLAVPGMDYREAADHTRLNGEPGYIWLDNARAYGRMGDRPNNRDRRAAGVNPCIEQTLESWELCCLVETFPFLHDSLEDFLRTLKFAYLYAKTVTLGPTPWSKTNRVMLRNRRIGCSMSGIVQAIEKLGLEEFRRWCEEGYQTIQGWDETYSEWLAIPRSIKTTSVKPSGTVSLLAGATPGLHYPEDRYYIRRIRMGSTSSLLKYVHKAGYPVEQDMVDPGGVVVEVPVQSPCKRTTRDVSMWEQLALAAFMQRHWADNQVSVTVTFDPETEGPQIAHALDFYQYQLKGVSFLPRTEKGVYAQMPYEGIAECDYVARMAQLKPLHIGVVKKELADAERFCDGEACALQVGEEVAVDGRESVQTAQ